MAKQGIDVCIATYRRVSLEETLKSVLVQELPEDVSIRIIVADNDQQPSAATLVSEVAAKTVVPVHYVHAPAQNISIARNACLDAAQAEWVAFIDDDEIAAPDWLATLLAKAASERLTAVFGPARARYTPDTPVWIQYKDYHSNHPHKRKGVVETGHTCNALMRRTDPLVSDERFLESRGRTGGEDTEFFFRLHQKGARFGISDKAEVYEPVEPERLSFKWLAKRKYRYGQTYGQHAAGDNQQKKYWITGLAAGKVLLCITAALLFCWSASERNYWALRGIFHAGVVSTLFGIREQYLY